MQNEIIVSFPQAGEEKCRSGGARALCLTLCIICIIMSNTKEAIGVLLKLDMSSRVPIYMQIRNQIVLGIASGELAPGEKLPTIRALAGQSGVNMMTVNKAYALLKQEGYITADRRGGTVVTGSPGAAGLNERYLGALRVIAAEARLTGMDEDGFAALCREIFREGGGGSDAG